jgi:hypothetical protein
MNDEKFLLIELKTIPHFWLTAELPEKGFLLNKTKYENTGRGEFLGFYDFLRNAADKVVGVRYFPFEDIQFLTEMLSGAANVEIRADGKIWVFYFSEAQNFVESKSDDQCFGDNNLFKSKDGAFLLTFRAPPEKLASKISRAEIFELLPQTV